MPEFYYLEVHDQPLAAFKAGTLPHLKEVVAQRLDGLRKFTKLFQAAGVLYSPTDYYWVEPCWDWPDRDLRPVPTGNSASQIIKDEVEDASS